MTTFNTRIQLKYDSLTNWQTKNPALLQGEVAFCTIGEITTDSKGNRVHPPIMYKVGPGNFNDLGWGSAIAADVYGWAKETGINVTVEGNGNVVSSIVWDSTLNDGKGGIKYTTASVATSEGLSNLENRVSSLETAIASLQNSLKNYLTIEDFEEFKTTNTKAIQDAQTKANDAYTLAESKDANIIETINVNESALTVTNKTVNITVPTEAQIKTLAAEEINALIGGADNEDTIEGITTLVNYVNTHGAETTALVTEVFGSSNTSGTSRIDTLETELSQNINNITNNYVTKDSAVGYDDILTQTEASSTYATFEDVNTAKTEATSYTDTKIGELKLDNIPQVENSYIILNCGTATEVI